MKSNSAGVMMSHAASMLVKFAPDKVINNLVCVRIDERKSNQDQ
ncbi:hypothetical protein [Shewanella mangrovi]|nr:hypothetical protein [Shewanella mangrovi]